MTYLGGKKCYKKKMANFGCGNGTITNKNPAKFLKQKM